MNSRKKSLWALLVTQFFGAFNDNIFKVAVSLLAVQIVTDPVQRNTWVTASGVLFVVPFLLFSLVAGRMADRWSKRQVIVATKGFEVVIVAVACLALLGRSLPLMMVALLLLAFQATFFGPAKYGILPELVDEAQLSSANGFLNLATFVAILAGTVAASFLVGNVGLITLIMAAGTVAGLASSLVIDRVPAANPSQPLAWNPLPDFFHNWRLVKGDAALRQSLIAVSYFWFVGAVLQLNTLIYVADVLKAPPTIAGELLTLVVIGVAVGSLIAGRLSQQKVELGLVPLGALGMTIFTLDLGLSGGSMHRAMADGLLIGLFSGLFVIPLNTLIQLRSPAGDRGRVLATANFLSFVAILAASAFLWVTGSALKLSPAATFVTLGVLSFAATALVCITIPQSVVRLVLYFFTNTVYRIRVIGRENVPVTGPALLVPNHVSMADPFLVAGGMSRVARFLMWRGFYEKPLIHPFVKLMKAIPIANTDSPKEIMRSLLNARKELENGHIVCIFAEGEISRVGGSMLGFKKGLEVILKGLDVPVIPVHLEGVWGSIFSFERKKFFWKRPKKIPYPVTVTFGEPMKSPTADQIRQRVLDLGSTAFAVHRQREKTLFASFLTQAKSTPRARAISDSSGQNLSFHGLLTAATLVGRRLHDQKPGERVGILLPPSVGATVANVALVSQGHLPVNLNYTLSKDAILAICRRAGIRRIVTSEKMLEKLAWLKGDEHLLLESVLASIGGLEKAGAAALLAVTPRFLLWRTVFRRAPRRLDDLATIMFTSGTTGVPKGVMLTQANLLSNIQALTMVLNMQPTDAILGVLPFFHSFGFTATLWFPLIAGFRAVYHHNPLDSKVIGELCRKSGVTFLIGTPTFLSAYLRRIEKEDLATLRFAVTGAEKLRPELAKAFEEKYGVPLLEGYGCTELSPVVAVNVPDIMDGEVFQVGRKVGKIGRPIPGVSVRVVDPDSFAPLAAGKPGLLLVKGPNVMKGYFEDPAKTAEAIRDGWYVTGDIATIDEDGFIQITDRLSRFSKIGGEMVPHILVEEKLHEAAKTADRQFVVTSIPDEKKGEALAVLVAGFTGDLDQLCRDLGASGLPNLWIPARNRFVSVESIPMLGSGKVDVQAARAIALQRFAPSAG